MLLSRQSGNLSEQQLTGARAYRELVETISLLDNQNKGLRELANKKESYTVYLINGIRERCSWKPLDFFAWLDERNGRPRNGEQASRFVEALLDAFDLASFDQMLLFQCERERQEITTASGLRNIVLEVVQAANREGWVEQLRQGALAANPTNVKLNDVLAK